MTPILFALLFAAAPEPPSPPPDLNKPPADALNIGNGLITKVLVPGKGTEQPSADDFVKIRTTPWS